MAMLQLERVAWGKAGEMGGVQLLGVGIGWGTMTFGRNIHYIIPALWEGSLVLLGGLFHGEHVH